MIASRIAALLTSLIALAALTMPTQVGAQSMIGARPIAGASDIVQVRDGCGPGMRFSERRQACVEDFDRGPPPPRYYEDRGPRYVAPPPRRYVDCGPGKRYSERLQGCVWIDGERRSDDGAAAAAVAGGLLGAAIGAAAGSRDGDRNRDVRRGPPPSRAAGPAPQPARAAPAAAPVQRAAPAARPAGPGPAVGRIGGDKQ